MINIFCDGSSLKNPGHSGVGVVVFEKDKKIKEISKYTSIKTNNEAEYLAVLEALNYMRDNNLKSATILCDSELLVNQLNLKYNVKNENLKMLFNKVQELKKDLDLKFLWIPREENLIADDLSKKASSLKLDKLEEKENSKKYDFIFEKVFFAKTTCFKIQISESRECYFHIGLNQNLEKWVWEKVKINENEIGEIIYSLSKIEHKTSFFHKFNNSNNQIWINKSEKSLTIKINKVSKSFGIGEIEVLKIILKKIIEIMNF